jgi:hypothetical protein
MKSGKSRTWSSWKKARTVLEVMEMVAAQE